MSFLGKLSVMGVLHTASCFEEESQRPEISVHGPLKADKEGCRGDFALGLKGWQPQLDESLFRPDLFKNSTPSMANESPK